MDPRKLTPTWLSKASSSLTISPRFAIIGRVAQNMLTVAMIWFSRRLVSNLTRNDEMKKYHLAQINIAQAKADMDGEIMRGFVQRLDEINALADAASGFVWRLQTEDGDATALRVFDDAMLIINMSVWEDIESLKNYVFKSLHVELIRDREAWFNKLGAAHQALWWVPAGHIPTVEEARAKLDHIRAHGPSPEVFTFGRSFATP